ncbi:hypothetical protein COY05_00820 [Candidatus Peregrinibacteria bacterium CG_4_10_14_0_2_um_filter_38_24]|nr:MAG: hypothetical protein COY05_00820 [Candidatus Peregrinibacteria bacterium CG_4_10_14_0_2_um_filter_38_24]PJC38872.1 MAG: hypothetical protein CO044_02715 [Candidatus Peregrinibacteria bacterium CG_4_9_14_0_2_um_filter_38_9]
MQINEYKKYSLLISVAVCGILTIASVAFFLFLYVSWGNTDDKITPEVIEIRLPVMNWSQYSILSKKYENGILKNDIKK